MLETVKIGFIGCGGNARGHMKRLMETPHAQIVAVCDVVQDLANEAAEQVGGQAYTDHRALLDHDDLNAVYISIPVFAHGQPEFDTIQRGLPFLVEKPVAIDLATAKEIEAKVQASGLITAVGYQLRYAGTADRTREVLAGQRVGMLNGKYWCGSGIGDPTRWLRQMSRSGGQLVEQATHTIDMMRFLGGEVTEVFCYQASQVLTEIDCPDFCASTMKFANGAVGTITTAWAYQWDWNNTNTVDILYENARLNWTYSKLTIWDGKEPREITESGPSIDTVFVEAVRTGDASKIRSPYSDAVRSLAVSLAMNESARVNAPVPVQL